MSAILAQASATFTANRALDGDAAVVVFDPANPGGDLTAISAAAGERLACALGRLGPTDPPLDVRFPDGFAVGRLLLWPWTPGSDAGGYRVLGGRIAGALKSRGERVARIVMDAPPADAAMSWAADLAYGAVLRSYAFAGHRSTARAAPAVAYEIVCGDPAAAHTAFAPLAERAASVHLARDLTAEPPSVLTPAAFARRIEALAGHGLEVEILDGAALAQLGLRALLAVARGSDEPPFVAVLRWRGADDPHAPPVALVGKGVTFDAGGLNLKPTAFMFRMKNYMGGAAAVVGALRALAARRARVNAVGVVGLVENMPSGRAYRPGDVLQTFSGKTVEVIDTDNEGRLVLCDLVAWAEHTLAPRAIVDIATLTGGARFALGAVYAPVFANDEALCAALVAAGEAEGERLWRLPTGPAYDPMFASPVADMTNGRTDIQAHAILGARFLERFVDHTPWAHFDMAAVCTTETDLDCAPAGFTGFGAALLDRFAGG